MPTRLVMPLAVLIAAGALVACSPQDPGNDLDRQVHQVMDAPRYRNAMWNLVMVDLASGDLAETIRPDTYFLPGSTAKLFSAGAALEVLGAQSRVTTPVYQPDKLAGGKDLVLVASGDMNLGGRAAGTSSIEFADFDHNEANVLPRASLTPADPLAGLDHLAAQARESIDSVDGEVIVDDRLFIPYSGWNDGVVSPIMLNDNVIDLVITPTGTGSAAAVTQRPLVSGFVVKSEVLTGPPDSEASISVERNEDGRIEVTGSIPAGGDTAIRVFKVEDPGAFARAAFIDALRRAGVVVAAQPGTANPTVLLPAKDSYSESDRVGALESATLADEIKVILKVSFNRGADLLICRLAVASGSSNCLDGMARMAEIVKRAGLADNDVYLFDGAGSDDHTRTSPAAFIKWLEFAKGRPWGGAFTEALPIMGVDGSLADVGTTSAAMGKVRAKTGTRATATPTGGVLLYAKSLAGYLEARSGKTYAIVISVNGVPIDGIDGIVEVIDDFGAIAALLQQSN